MTQIRFSPWSFTLLSLLTLGTFNLISSPDSLAQRSNRDSQNTTSTEQTSSQRRATGRLRGLGTREGCYRVDKPLTAVVGLVPTKADLIAAETTETLPPATIIDHPTFWFYIPYSPDAGLSAEFLLFDENEEDVYKTKFPLKEKPGFISVKLPETSPPLETGKRYTWVFSVICAPDNRSNDIFVHGEIDRIPVDATLQAQLETITDPEAESALYAENQLWSEALTTLAEARRRNLQDTTLETDWSNLLESMNLNDLASEPLTPCCTQE